MRFPNSSGEGHPPARIPPFERLSRLPKSAIEPFGTPRVRRSGLGRLVIMNAVPNVLFARAN